MILESLTAALLPAIIDGVTGLVRRKIAPPVPLKPADHIALADADARRLEALAKLDAATGPVHTWVNDVRALQRPVAVAVILGAYVGSIATNQAPETVAQLGTFAQYVTFYLFGERALMKFKTP